MATSGAALRALVMANNAEARVAEAMLRQAKQKLEEVREGYARISEKLEPSVNSIRRADSSIEEPIVMIYQAIQFAEAYAASVA